MSCSIDGKFDIGQFDNSCFDTLVEAVPRIPTKIEVTISQMNVSDISTSEINKGSQSSSERDKGTVIIDE